MKRSASRKVEEVRKVHKLGGRPVDAEITTMWALLERGEGDDTHKLTLADKLTEAGDHELASVIDWCVKRKRWPKFQTKEVWNRHLGIDETMYWWWGIGTNITEAPKSLGNGLGKPFHEFVVHGHVTLQEAIEALADGMVTLRRMMPDWRS